MLLKLKRTPGIYLAGFMGSGKTEVGRLLADELGWNFVDLDADIEAAQGMPITEIFDTRGEPEFRQMERAALQERVREVERGHASRWGESSDPLVHQASTPADAARLLAARLASGALHRKGI